MARIQLKEGLASKLSQDINMQEEALVSQRLVYDVLQCSEKQVWNFSITQYLRKITPFGKLAYQRKKLGQNK